MPSTCFDGHRGPHSEVAVAADGRVASTAGQDGVIGVWDTATGENIRFLRGHQGAATAVVVVGESIAAGGEDGTIRLWSLSSGESQRVIRLGESDSGSGCREPAVQVLVACLRLARQPGAAAAAGGLATAAGPRRVGGLG